MYAPIIQNSNQMVDRNYKFSEGIFSTPAIFNVTSKLFGSQGCAALMTKNDFPFPAFSLKFVDFAAQFCFRCNAPINVKPSSRGGGGGIRRGIGRGFNIFKECAVRFPIPGKKCEVKCN